ncbi:hypothetical protein F183_A50910 [Bryobacterales bacterium F-183]|nr:hypothetical protein F183_A50910 [Bryobacterales bacterium F-183]
MLFRKLVTCCGLLFAFLGSQNTAKADVVLTLLEVGPNVVLSGGGTLNLSAMTFVAPSVLSSLNWPALGILSSASPSASLGDAYQYVPGFIGPPNYGPGLNRDMDVATGASIGFGRPFNLLLVPVGYASGAPLSVSSTFQNATLASIGATPGTYVWTWGSGVTAGSLTLHVGPVAVPEPSAGMLILGCTGLAFLTRRIRRSH